MKTSINLINKVSTLNGTKYFSLGIFQNILNIIVALFGLNRGNLMQCQKKILKT